MDINISYSLKDVEMFMREQEFKDAMVINGMTSTIDNEDSI
jgi:hypothetical protein